jgi:hypothetical protein
MLATPAGTEISVRIAGTSRQKNTAARPWRWNQAFALSTSAGCMVIQRPCRAAQRFTLSSPSERPT